MGRPPTIILCDVNQRVCDAWRQVFDEVALAGCPIRIENRSILELSAEAYVSPGNSFGHMNGGIDWAYAERFPGIEQRVQASLPMFSGELLVGQAVTVPTGDADVRHLIYAPTMRVPMVIRDPVDVYLATRAAMVAALALDEEIRRVAFPGMGTGAGMVAPIAAARCMWRGIKDAIEGPPRFSVPHDQWHDHFRIPMRRLGGQ